MADVAVVVFTAVGLAMKTMAVVVITMFETVVAPSRSLRRLWCFLVFG